IPKNADGQNAAGLPNVILRAGGATRAEGAFEVRGLSPGSYTLLVLPQAAPVTRLGGQVDVTVADSDVKDVVLALGSAGAVTVTGRLRLEDGDIKSILA